MISFIEKNYFKINLLFLSVISFYCMAGLIVPLQSISANKFVTLGMTLMGVLLGLYNFFIKKEYSNSCASCQVWFFNKYKKFSSLLHLFFCSLSSLSVFHREKSACYF